MNHRPYPNAARALAQVERHPGPLLCPVCGHAVSKHAMTNGVATCTAGPPASCGQCEADWRAFEWGRALALLGRSLNRIPQLVVFTGRQAGKAAAMRDLERQALDRGEHVHRFSAIDGEHCLGGMPNCRTPRAQRQLPEGEARR